MALIWYCRNCERRDEIADQSKVQYDDIAGCRSCDAYQRVVEESEAFRCDECDGLGEVECEECNGDGIVPDDSGLDEFGVDCGECHGSGTVPCVGCQ
jgi:hypothetical protein